MYNINNIDENLSSENAIDAFVNSLSIFVKLAINLFILSSMGIAIGWYSSFEIEQTASNINDVFSKSLQSVSFSKSAENKFLNMEFLLYKSYKAEKYTIAAEETINVSLERFREDLEIASERSISQNSVTVLQDLNRLIAKWEVRKNDIYRDGTNKYQLFTDMQDISIEIKIDLNDLSEFETAAAYSKVLEANDVANDMQNLCMIVAVLALMSCMFVAGLSLLSQEYKSLD